ncbi:MAG: hypothetical protein COB66_09605, partial [Coxiella sp. (in: Bacteria)]
MKEQERVVRVKEEISPTSDFVFSGGSFDCAGGRYLLNSDFWRDVIRDGSNGIISINGVKIKPSKWEFIGKLDWFSRRVALVQLLGIENKEQYQRLCTLMEGNTQRLNTRLLDLQSKVALKGAAVSYDISLVADKSLIILTSRADELKLMHLLPKSSPLYKFCKGFVSQEFIVNKDNVLEAEDRKEIEIKAQNGVKIGSDDLVPWPKGESMTAPALDKYVDAGSLNKVAETIAFKEDKLRPSISEQIGEKYVFTLLRMYRKLGVDINKTHEALVNHIKDWVETNKFEFKKKSKNESEEKYKKKYKKKFGSYLNEIRDTLQRVLFREYVFVSMLNDDQQLDENRFDKWFVSYQEILTSIEGVSQKELITPYKSECWNAICELMREYKESSRSITELLANPDVSRTQIQQRLASEAASSNVSLCKVHAVFNTLKEKGAKLECSAVSELEELRRKLKYKNCVHLVEADMRHALASVTNVAVNKDEWDVVNVLRENSAKMEEAQLVLCPDTADQMIARQLLIEEDRRQARGLSLRFLYGLENLQTGIEKSQARIEKALDYVAEVEVDYYDYRVGPQRYHVVADNMADIYKKTLDLSAMVERKGYAIHIRGDKESKNFYKEKIEENPANPAKPEDITSKIDSFYDLLPDSYKRSGADNKAQIKLWIMQQYNDEFSSFLSARFNYEETSGDDTSVIVMNQIKAKDSGIAERLIYFDEETQEIRFILKGISVLNTEIENPNRSSSRRSSTSGQYEVPVTIMSGLSIENDSLMERRLASVNIPSGKFDKQVSKIISKRVERALCRSAQDIANAQPENPQAQQLRLVKNTINYGKFVKRAASPADQLRAAAFRAASNLNEEIDKYLNAGSTKWKFGRNSTETRYIS